MRRFFVPPESINGGVARISGPEAHHIVRVLRMRPGDRIILCDGSGREFEARIMELDRKSISAVVEKVHPPAPDSDVAITLIQGLPKGDKFDQIVARVTEIGVRRIIPVISERVVVRLGDGSRKFERWTRISAEAARVSGRARPPEIWFPRSYGQALKALEQGTALLIPWEKEKKLAFREAIKQVRSTHVAVAVGPEGGWSEREVELALELGGVSVTLGPRILRCETCAVAVVSLAMYELGDLGG